MPLRKPPSDKLAQKLTDHNHSRRIVVVLLQIYINRKENQEEWIYTLPGIFPCLCAFVVKQILAIPPRPGEEDEKFTGTMEKQKTTEMSVFPVVFAVLLW